MGFSFSFTCLAQTQTTTLLLPVFYLAQFVVALWRRNRDILRSIAVQVRRFVMPICSMVISATLKSVPRPTLSFRPTLRKKNRPRSFYHRLKCTIRSTAMNRLNELLVNNKKWAAEKTDEQQDYFSRYAKGQWPEFLWIGCADSRVVANDIIGMQPGDVFTHRNVGNIVCHSDMNCMSVLEYGVGALKVKHVIVCGHYGCGAVKASLTLPAKTAGVVNGWIASIRDVRNKYATVLNALPEDKRPDLLSELNALEQMIHVCTSPAVQAAWDREQELYVHALVYDITTGKLKVLVPGVTSLDQLLELKSFHEGIVSEDGAKSTFDDSLKKLVALESVAK